MWGKALAISQATLPRELIRGFLSMLARRRFVQRECSIGHPAIAISADWIFPEYDE
jgi:hypothetical protein